MFEFTVESVESGQISRHRLYRAGAPIAYATVLDLWQTDAAFRSRFNTLLADSPYPAYRWETPAISRSTAHRPFEFVLINTPRFDFREADSAAYARYFTDDDADSGIVAFDNLGGDAALIVPSPRSSVRCYGHLAAFVRHAPAPQRDSIWRVLGKQVIARIGSKPVWVSTAGGGVAWLHLRIDSRPKYYGHPPYRTPSE